MEIPRIISVDDHVIEPAHVWQDYLPAAFRDAGPRLTRVKGRLRFEPRHMAFREDPEGYWADCWLYAGLLFPVTGGFAAVSFPREAPRRRPRTTGTPGTGSSVATPSSLTRPRSSHCGTWRTARTSKTSSISPRKI